MHEDPSPKRPDADDPPVESGGRKPFLLRLSPDLHAELKRWAASELRSLNGQIEFLLREAVRHRRPGGAPGDSDGNTKRAGGPGVHDAP